MGDVEVLCSICSRWPPAMRQEYRRSIVEPRKPMCRECFCAFWENMGCKRAHWIQVVSATDIQT
jgi:hypothetical protein